MAIPSDGLARWVGLSALFGALLALTACGYPVVNRTDLSEAQSDGRLNGIEPQRVLDSLLCAVPRPGRAPARRLSNAEYANTLGDLLGDAELVADAMRDFPNEPESLGFRNGADTLTVNSLMAGRYLKAAERVAETLRVPCETQGDAFGELRCAEDFIRDFGLRVYRRPLAADEVERYLDLYRRARERDGFRASMPWVAVALLQSPYFLYRVTLPGIRGTERVTGFEMASRLSYLLWQSAPDDALLIAASRGELSDRAQVLRQAERMLADAKAARVYEFFEQWLDFDDLSGLDRDPELYPALSPRLAELMRVESRAFVSDLLSRAESNLGDLLTREETFVNRELAEHYALTPVAGDMFRSVPAPGRFGVLTQGMLAVRDAPTRTSIVRRGLAIRTKLLCDTVPAPPDEVDFTLSGIGADLSQQQRLEQHRSIPACNGCHELMDPLGVVFEGFDAVGRQRERDEYGGEARTRTIVSGTRDLDGPYDDLKEFAAKMAESSQVRECYMLQHFRFFYGRDATADDLCSQAQLLKQFRDHDFGLVALLRGLTQTDAFLYKPGASLNEEAP